MFPPLAKHERQHKSFIISFSRIYNQRPYYQLCKNSNHTKPNQTKPKRSKAKHNEDMYVLTVFNSNNEQTQKPRRKSQDVSFLSLHHSVVLSGIFVAISIRNIETANAQRRKQNANKKKVWHSTDFLNKANDQIRAIISLELLKTCNDFNFFRFFSNCMYLGKRWQTKSKTEWKIATISSPTVRPSERMFVVHKIICAKNHQQYHCQCHCHYSFFFSENFPTKCEQSLKSAIVTVAVELQRKMPRMTLGHPK